MALHIFPHLVHEVEYKFAHNFCSRHLANFMVSWHANQFKFYCEEEEKRNTKRRSKNGCHEVELSMLMMCSGHLVNVFLAGTAGRDVDYFFQEKIVH